MKFYEFNDFEYYALIGASTIEDAMKEYTDIICDIENENIKPIEISKKVALTKCQAGFGLKTAEYMFNDLIERYKTHIFLIDGGLDI